MNSPSFPELGGFALVLANYTFASFLWDFILIMAFFIWFWLLIVIFGDIFRRHDIGGGMKALWTIFVIVLPYLGVLVYLIAEHKGMAERSMKSAAAQQAATDEYIRSVAGSGGGGGGAAAEIERAKGLLDSGAITQAEFDSIKAKALA
jgi:hypothetical protein